MKLILVEDRQARRWSPFSSTRPAGELLFGASLLRERIERWVARDASGYLVADSVFDAWQTEGEDAGGLGSGNTVRPGTDVPGSQSGSEGGAGSGGGALAGFDEVGAPPVLDRVPSDSRTLYWLSRAAPELNAAPLPMSATPATAFVAEGIVVGLWLPEGPGDGLPDPLTLLGSTADGLSLPTMQAEVVVLDWPWSLVEANARVLSRDLEWLHGHDDVGELPGVHRVGSAALSLAPDAQLGPGVVVDTRDGPVRLEKGVTVEGPARLTGPLLLGAGSQVFGGHLSRLSTGPVCKLRGEIDTAVLTGFCNKAHDGYLGHALLGRWVNLGALTTNSDLKNDYGPVRVDLGHEVVDTGLMKVGVFLGDHVKTGIGTVLNTGSVVGAGCNVFGGGMPPKYLPPFSWAGGGAVVPFRWEKFLKVARVVFGRRDQEWTPGVEAILSRLWQATHGGAAGDGP